MQVLAISVDFVVSNLLHRVRTLGTAKIFGVRFVAGLVMLHVASSACMVVRRWLLDVVTWLKMMLLHSLLNVLHRLLVTPLLLVTQVSLVPRLGASAFSGNVAFEFRFGF